MNPKTLAVLALLLLSTPAFALMGLRHLTKADVQRLDIKLDVKPAGPDAVWIGLDFPITADLKQFDSVFLEIYDGEKVIVSTQLKEHTLPNGRIAIQCRLARDMVDRSTLRIITGFASNHSANDLLLKDHVDLAQVK